MKVEYPERNHDQEYLLVILSEESAIIVTAEYESRLIEGATVYINTLITRYGKGMFIYETGVETFIKEKAMEKC